MLHKMFTVLDQMAKAHLPPFVMPNEEMAMRTFGDCVNDPKHRFGEHPEDYTLIVLGEWDDNTGRFLQYDIPEVLGLGTKFVRSKFGNGEKEDE